MRRVEPKVYLIAEPHVRFGAEEPDDSEGLQDYLEHVGAPEWETDAASHAEELVEVAGRLCYNSYKPGLNPNVQKVREGNAAYMANILGTRHGSVLEHSQCSFIFTDVSRVFTAELCRHRAGVAISERSLRYVRLTDLGLWLPSVIAADPEATAIFEETFRQLEALQLKLAEHFKLDKINGRCPRCNYTDGINYFPNKQVDGGVLVRVCPNCGQADIREESVPFARKKEITSAMRRIAPIGLATAICWSANFRTLRWVIELRTDAAAEEEIRLVFDKVAQICVERYPAAFGDFEEVKVEGSSIPAWKPRNGKV